MTKIAIGKRAVLPSVKEVWQKEPEFSDWLAKDEGIELIAQDLGIEIENTKRELKGSNFPCDIVANVVGDEKHIVVIENQYGKSDHDHLAKLLTYAAAHKAMTGIWICEEAKDDHRQVIDWLNQNTPETLGLYLVEVKAYTIGSSPAALQLDAVSRPNILNKPDSGGFTQAEKEKRAWRKTYWSAVHDRMRREKLPFRLQKPGPEYWSTIALGRSGFQLDMWLTPKNKAIGLEVVIQPAGWKDDAFQLLRTKEKEIEGEVGRNFNWREMSGQKSARVTLEEKLDPGKSENQEKVCEWFAHWTPKVYLAFRDRIKSLTPSGQP